MGRLSNQLSFGTSNFRNWRRYRDHRLELAQRHHRLARLRPGRQGGASDARHTVIWGHDAQGRVRKVACTTAGNATTKAGRIIRKCALVHEKSHFPEIPCESCTRDPTRPERSGPGALPYDQEAARGRCGALRTLKRSAAMMSIAKTSFSARFPIGGVGTKAAIG